MDKAVIKVAAGKRNRNYSRRFLDYDIAVLGPGGPGRWEPADEGAYKRGDQSALRAFAGARDGDLALLTIGYKIVTAGRIVGGYDHDESLGLVGGWDLFHYRRVMWARPEDPEVEAHLKRHRSPKLPIQSKCCRLSWGSKGQARWAKDLDRALEDAGYWERREIAEMPADASPVPLDEVGPWLPSDHATEILEVVRETKGLWEAIHERGWEYVPSENEAVALIVVPFLLALGWEPRNLALEWERMDVACFGGVKRSPEECAVIVEAKRPGDGLDWAHGQAVRYAKKHDFRPTLILTNGFYWAIYERPDSEQALGETFLPGIHDSEKDRGFFSSLSQIAP